MILHKIVQGRVSIVLDRVGNLKSINITNVKSVRFIYIIVKLDLIYRHQKPPSIVLLNTDLHLLNFKLEFKLVLNLFNIFLNRTRFKPTKEEFVQSQKTCKEWITYGNVHCRQQGLHQYLTLKSLETIPSKSCSHFFLIRITLLASHNRL